MHTHASVYKPHTHTHTHTQHELEWVDDVTYICWVMAWQATVSCHKCLLNAHDNSEVDKLFTYDQCDDVTYSTSSMSHSATQNLAVELSPKRLVEKMSQLTRCLLFDDVVNCLKDVSMSPNNLRPIGLDALRFMIHLPNTVVASHAEARTRMWS